MKIFIVGAGSGLGLEITKKALRMGHTVGVSTSADISPFAAESRMTSVVLASDLTVVSNTHHLIAEILRFAPDRLIFCAVRTQFRPLSFLSRDETEAEIAFNVTAPINVISAYAKAHPAGSVTFLLSHICFLYNPGFTLYKMAKDALDSFSKSLQFEYPRLQVLRVYPGALKTPFAARSGYNGLKLRAPQDPAVWATKILDTSEGTLIGPVDLLLLCLSKVVPFGIQKRVFALLFRPTAGRASR